MGESFISSGELEALNSGTGLVCASEERKVGASIFVVLR